MKISIITATFNSEKFIENCLNSILNQTYSHFEIIIVDGKSSDRTVQIINSFSDSRIRMVSEKDSGIYYALNKGLALCSGDIIGFLHSDDFFCDTNVLQNIANEFYSKPSLDGCYGNLKYVHHVQTNKVMRDWRSKLFSEKNLKFGWMPPHPTLFLKKEVYQLVGNFNTRFRIAADYDFLLRIFHQPKLKISHLDIYITNMRIGGASNGSLKSIFRKSKEDYLVISQFKLLGWITLIFKNLRKIPQLFNF